MRLGQTSVIYYLSRVLAAVLGFLATIYYARALGAEPVGIYYLAIGVVSWLAIAGKIGISGAITKRVSEGEERERYALAGLSIVGVLFVVLATGIVLSRPHVNDYLGHPAAGYVILILLVSLAWSVVSSLLTGLHLVHLKGLLTPVKTGGRALAQIGAVTLGLGLTGLFVGHVAGFALVAVVGGTFVIGRLNGVALPGRRHYRSLFEYAKFSWLGRLETRMFNHTDVIVLGVFVPQALIGIYSIAWNIAMFFILFSGSISTTLFPEMSERAANETPQAVADLLEEALSYAGLLLIPGLVGGVLLGERVLRLYGDEFTQGTTILALLITAALFRAYQKQHLNTLNAIDRPDLSFRANAAFVVLNLTLNVVLIYVYGWIGGAVATGLSVLASLAIAYRYLSSIIDYTIPVVELAYQWLAALLMGAVVTGGLWVENSYGVLNHNAATVIVLVGLGAATYFLVLLGLSGRFRRTVSDNLPFEGSRLVG